MSFLINYVENLIKNCRAHERPNALQTMTVFYTVCGNNKENERKKEIGSNAIVCNGHANAD